MDFKYSEHPHRRYNALTGEWLLVSPHRTKRPWQGQTEDVQSDERQAYDPGCYLCPGNKRSNGEVNDKYTETFVFTNDFPALLPDAPKSGDSPHPLLKHEGVQGTCRVVCFAPEHNLTLPELPVESIRKVIDTWADQVLDLGIDYRWVQVFENKGEMMGCSNPHPHGQIWALNTLPNEVFKENSRQADYFIETDSVLLVDYLQVELEKKERIVVENDDWVAVVPYWAEWPFEMLLLPREHILRIPDLTVRQRDNLSDILKRMLTKYDNLFNISFPYTMGWHGAPMDHSDNSHWQLHAHFYPPLLRSSTVRKFMVGYEMMAEAQRDLTPEQAADRLRGCSEIHFRIADPR